MRRLTANATFAVAAVAIILVCADLKSLPCNDVWWHLATARIMTATHAVPTIEPFSWTRAGEPYFNQPWLAQLVFYALHRIGGAPLLLFGNALAVTATAWILCRIAWRRTNQPRLAAWGVLAIFLPLGVETWSVRPQTLTMPLFALVLSVLADAFGFVGIDEATIERGKRRLWLLPAAMLLWVNLHGSFVLCLALPILAAIGHVTQLALSKRLGGKIVSAPAKVDLRRVAFVLAVTGLASLANPRGPSVYTYVAHLASTRANQTINVEWAATSVHTTSGALFYAIVVLLLVMLFLTRARRRPTLSELAIVGFVFWQGAATRRAIPWFGYVVMPLLVVLFADVVRAIRKGTEETIDPPGSPIPLVVVGFLVVLTSPWVKTRLPIGEAALLVEDGTPVAAVERLNAEPASSRPKHLFNDIQYGCYLQFAAPEQKVFVDTRMDFYPWEIYADYLSLARANAGDVDRLVAKWSIDGMLLDKAYQAPLAKAVRADGSWTVRFEDEHTLYVARTRSSD